MARGNEGSTVTDADQQMLEKKGEEEGWRREGTERQTIGGGKNCGRRGVEREVLD